MEHDKHAGHSPEMFKQKFWLSLALTVPAVVFSHAVQGWFNIHWTFPGVEYIPPIFGTIIFFYGGMVFLKSAKAELANKLPGMMTLISMAIIVAFGYSLAVTFKLVDGMDFWWELATLITIMLLGHWLEMASVMKAEGALHELAKLLPDEAELVGDNDDIKIVPVSSLKVGDMILVRPGGQIPTDGKVVDGDSDVNESMLTGESTPMTKTTNTTVTGGTINGSGSLLITVTKVGKDTALAGIMKLVAEAQSSKSTTQILADKAAFYLTLAAIGAALVTGIIWAIIGETPSFILERVVTVLIIACPHALGLAIPLVTAISTTLAAKNGLLIRQRLALESARNIDIVLFDKTGTLTKGQQGVTDIWSTEGYTDTDILQLTASLEQHSEHVIGKGIVQKANDKKLKLASPAKFTALPGLGVRGKLHGDEYIAASRRYIAEHNIELPKTLAAKANNAAKQGKTEVFLIKQKVVLGCIALADEIRPESRETITALRDMGIQTAMITGDSQDVASYVARELNIDLFFAEVRPEDKSTKIKELQANGKRVAMVGDGVNDAPALTKADVGIAIGAGTDVAIESAGIVLISSDPRGVVKIMNLSRAAYRKMLQNLAWAAGYNTISIPLAAGITAGFGFVLSPAIGAVLMSLSTVIVAINAQLLRKINL
jgi:Cu2+-exporting ATPase